MNIEPKIAAASAELIAIRRDIHAHPELGFEEERTSRIVAGKLEEWGVEVTTGIGPDLMEGARMAVSGMIDLLGRRFGYSAVDAYMLCSVCADLRISSIVDVPNWVVSFYFPRIVLE